jgi:hypothetical protein
MKQYKTSSWQPTIAYDGMIAVLWIEECRIARIGASPKNRRYAALDATGTASQIAWRIFHRMPHYFI